MQKAVEAAWSAADLVERLRHDWLGTLNWGPVTLDDISLRSAAATWPPVIRLDFRSQDERHRWEDAWGHLEGMTLEAASNLWLGIVHAHMCEQGFL
jgi:hypothetical protein